MADMERRIKRGDLKQEKLDAIQVCLFSYCNLPCVRG
jgi:hypothetical protein